MAIDSEAKPELAGWIKESEKAGQRPAQAANIGLDMVQGSLERMTVALAKCTQLMDRHLAAGEQTVPARALYFILRDAGYDTSPAQKEEAKQTPKQEQHDNELHHNYGMRR
jgi:hypothetical protein